MQNLNHKQLKTTDSIEDLKSSITNLIDLAKTLQNVSGSLSLIGDECKNIASVSKQLQSNLSKIQKSLDPIETQKTSDSIDKFWLYQQSLAFIPLFSLPNPQVQRNWAPERSGKTFKKHLL